jgi:hypothetical protein
MDEPQLKLLANGIASIADAVDVHFEEVVEALVGMYVIDGGQLGELMDYLETL